MGIKGWLSIGGLVLTGLAVLFKVKQKEDEHLEKVRMMIREVDGGDEKTEETETEPASVETMSDDVEKAFRDMGLDEEADAYVGAMDNLNEIHNNTKNALNLDTIEKRYQADRVQKQMVLDSIKPKDQAEMPEDIAKDISNMSKNAVAKRIQEETGSDYVTAIMIEHAYRLKNDQEYLEGYNRWLWDHTGEIGSNKVDRVKMWRLQWLQDDPEYQKEQQERKEQIERESEEEWRKKVDAAIERKDFRKLEYLFDDKYAGGPWHPSPESVFGDAHRDGVITDEVYREAEKHFGRLWCYSGD